MPVDVDSVVFYLTARSIIHSIIFLSTYYSFWLQLALSVLLLVPYVVMRRTFDDDSMDELMKVFFVLVFLQGFTLILIRILVSKVALLLAELEVNCS